MEFDGMNIFSASLDYGEFFIVSKFNVLFTSGVCVCVATQK